MSSVSQTTTLTSTKSTKENHQVDIILFWSIICLKIDQTLHPQRLKYCLKQAWPACQRQKHNHLHEPLHINVNMWTCSTWIINGEYTTGCSLVFIAVIHIVYMLFTRCHGGIIMADGWARAHMGQACSSEYLTSVSWLQPVFWLGSSKPVPTHAVTIITISILTVFFYMNLH